MATERIDVEEKNTALIPRKAPSPALIAVAQQREIAEVQSKLIIARGNPRDRIESKDRIINACTDPDLAEKALYSYSRGGTEITGESIRLAEVMAQNWGNFEFGVRELEQRDGESTVEAYAWDLETNVSQRKIFQVPHIRYSKSKGNTKLSDPRDIYELIANNGARRMRACILGMIPTDVKEAAVTQCEETMTKKVELTPARIQTMLAKFKDDYAVTKEMIEKRIQRHVDSITPAMFLGLGKIYNSLKDGMSIPGDWFEYEATPKEGEKGTLSMADLKPKETSAPSPAAPQSTTAAPAKQTPKPKAEQPKAATQPAGNSNYADTEEDPFKSGELPL